MGSEYGDTAVCEWGATVEVWHEKIFLFLSVLLCYNKTEYLNVLE